MLVVEDDPVLRDKILVPSLKLSGFEAVGVGTAGELYRAVADHRFSLVVLDIGLPDENGVSVAGRLRTMSDVGIIMLTGMDTPANHVRALKQGADAYLAKPVDMEVLAATLHRLARRMDQSTVRPGAWRLEPGGWRIVAPNGTAVTLSEPERLILACLAASPGEPVRRDVLLSLLDAHIEKFDPARLEMLVHRLRRKVAAKADAELPLVAVRGVGYVLGLS